MSWRLIVHLARHRRWWLIGIAVAAASYVVHAEALPLAPLSVVQPLLTTVMVLAVHFSVRRHHLPLHAREWTAVVVVTGAPVVGLGAAALHPAMRSSRRRRGCRRWRQQPRSSFSLVQSRKAA